MIDVNRIRSLKGLEKIRRDLEAFLENPDILRVYTEDFGWGIEDYEADKEFVTELLEKVNHRYASLSKFLKGQSKKSDQPQSPAQETTTVPSEP